MTCSTSEWRHQAGSRSTFRQRARWNFHCLRFARKEMGDSRCMHTRGVVSGDDDTYTSLYVISSRLQRTRIRRPPVKSAAIQTPLGDTLFQLHQSMDTGRHAQFHTQFHMSWRNSQCETP